MQRRVRNTGRESWSWQGNESIPDPVGVCHVCGSDAWRRMDAQGERVRGWHCQLCDNYVLDGEVETRH